MPIDLEFVKSLAQRAGEMALASSRTFRAELKPDDSWVTNVDREVEQFLRREIHRVYPDHSIYGEEYGLEGSYASGRVWFIDPIDGTTNFVKRIPAWCVSVGYVEDGEATVGVIAAPALGELYWASKGDGAFWSSANGGDREPLWATDVNRLHAEDTVGVSSDAQKTLPVARLSGRIRNLGSAAVDAAYIARGSLLASIYLNERAHDVAAGLCICREAGCEARWLADGRRLEIADLVERKIVTDYYLIGPPNALRLLRASLTLTS